MCTQVHSDDDDEDDDDDDGDDDGDDDDNDEMDGNNLYSNEYKRAEQETGSSALVCICWSSSRPSPPFDRLLRKG